LAGGFNEYLDTFAPQQAVTGCGTLGTIRCYWLRYSTLSINFLYSIVLFIVCINTDCAREIFCDFVCE
jgi:hypothetical protein